MVMYARGSKAKALCMRCGLLFTLPELVMDGYYPNIRVCTDCYDEPQPQEKLAVVSDPMALWRPAPDAMFISSPVLTLVQSGDDIVLSWAGFNTNASGTSITSGEGGDTPGAPLLGTRRSGGANITAGYYVQRSADQVAWTTLANLVNTADELGALVVETLTYTDTPAAGTWYYRVLGYDVLFDDPMG